MKKWVRDLCIAAITCLAGMPVAEAGAQVPDVTFDLLPRDSQLYPRDLVSNTAVVVVSGTVHSEGYDSIQLTTSSNGTEVSVQQQALVYDPSTNAAFELSSVIPAELVGYDFDLQLVQGVVTSLVQSVTNVVAGDMYMISGQSNAEAGEFNGSANGNQGPYVRSFGTRSSNGGTVAADVTWHAADGDIFAGPGASGQWGVRLARRLVDATGIPVAIINHANGGKRINFFQRNDGNHEDLNTNYGRMLFRTREAGATNQVRAILWYQGESDGGVGEVHETGFINLYNDWKENYPSIERVYVHQLRVGCGVTKEGVDLRDRQRRLPDQFPDMSVMSTTGISAHDGCHYPYVDGYETIGDHIFELVARDLYGAPDLPNIEAPNPVAEAIFADGGKTSLIVRTRNSSDTLVFDAGAEADFLLAGAAVTVTGGTAASNELTLALSGSGAAVTGLSYTGHSGSGPWVTNSLGVGLLTFTIPVTQFIEPPGTPTNLQATATPLLQAELSWDSASNVVSYLVRRDSNVVATVIGTAFTDNGLAPLTTYAYDVAGVNAQATSDFSAVAMVTTPALPPAPDTPTGLVATALSAIAIELDWPSDTNTLSFLVQRDSGVIAESFTNGYTDMGLTADTGYDYAIAAVNPGGTSAFSSVVSATTLAANVFAFVPEATNFQVVYRMEIPDTGNFRDGTPVPYIEDNTGSISGCIERIAYYLELDTGSGLEWVYVSMDPFTLDVNQIGLPHNVDNPVLFQQVVSNMNVFASAGAGVATGTTFSTGNIEMWPGCYTDANGLGLPGADDGLYDWDDSGGAVNACYGSFQVHNHGTPEVVFAYNAWSNPGRHELGIGSQPTGNPDWTFADNASSYLIKNLIVLVRELETPPLTVPTNLVAGGVGLVEFTLSWDPVPGAQFYDVRLDGVPSVRTTNVLATFTQLQPGTAYDLDVSAGNCHEQTSNSPSVTVTTLVASVYTNVAEASDFDLLYILDMEDSANYRNATPVPYALDNQATVAPCFDRVAYYLELDSEWVYVSMDAFTTNPVHLGLPHNTLGVSFQQVVDNMNVLASAGANVTTGSLFNTGNIEFWPNNYAQGNAISIPNASGATLDFGDTITAANPGYSCLQIHNHDLDGGDAGTTGETILAYNAWGAGNADDVGIGNDPNTGRGNYQPDWTFSGNASSYSNKSLTVLVRPFTLPTLSVPTNLVVTEVQDLEATVTWDAVPGAQFYDVRVDGVLHTTSLSSTARVARLAPETVYDVEVSAGNCAEQTPFSPSITFTTLVASVFADVPEAAGFELLYLLDIEDNGNYRDATPVPYVVDNTAAFTGCFDRIAYFLKLDEEWVYASMDAFTLDVNQVGVPHNTDNPVLFQQVVSNMNVFASAGASVATGMSFSTGNIEMWPGCYTDANGLGLPGADDGLYDWDDSGGAVNACYGSFQVHNHGTPEVVLAYNGWSSPARIDEVGIGSQPTNEPDWTFSASAPSYTTKNLTVLVRPSTPPPLPVPPNLAISGVGELQATLTWDAVPGAEFYDVRLDGVAFVTTVDSTVTVVCLQPDTQYDMYVSAGSCGGRSPFSSSVTFTTQVAAVFSNVAEASAFELVYALDIENDGNYRNSTPVPYCLDRSSELTQAFDRVAYYLELDSGSGAEWVYVSMDAFTNDVSRIGLPHNANAVLFQQVVSNMNVVAGGGAETNVTTGTGISTGNIEMWPSNYGENNDIGIPGADSATFDFGDGSATTAAGHSCFQVHNYGAGQTIFAYNHWGARGPDTVGIGNDPNTGRVNYSPDWTFAYNAATYTTKRLYVLMRPAGAVDDLDGDGLLDAWEIQYFGSITNANATTDLDEDGFLDLNEFIAGTIPTNPFSFLKTSIQFAPLQNEFRVQWPSVNGRVYQVEYSTNALQTWTVWSTNMIPTLPTNIVIDAPTGLESTFYRVRVTGP